MWLQLTSNTPGAPGLFSVEGSIANIFDFILNNQAGWQIEFTDTARRIYRPAVGNRHRLYINNTTAAHSAHQWAEMRGCENATDINTRIDEFPNTTQRAGSICNVLGSNISTDTSERFWMAFVSDTFMLFGASQVDPTQYTSDTSFEFVCFGDVAPMWEGDQWNTICGMRNAETTLASYGIQNWAASQHRPVSSVNDAFYWVRDYSGTVKSSLGSCDGYSKGFVHSSMPNPLGGFRNKIWRRRVFLHCTASATATPGAGQLPYRGQLPNIYHLYHGTRNNLGSLDTFQDSAYNPAANFTLIPVGGSSAMVMELTDTWSPLPTFDGGA